MNTPIYWTCQKCNNVGVVYAADFSARVQLELIVGDHADATDDVVDCELDLSMLTISREPGERHKAAEAQADSGLGEGCS